MILSNVDDALGQVQLDKDAGVKIALLTGDEDTSVFAIELRRDQFIPAHYHRSGIETYTILQGEGVASTGVVQDDLLIWKSEKHVKAGDCFTIYPHEVHRFQNLSEQPLRILATAPQSHIGKDRVFVEEKHLSR